MPASHWTQGSSLSLIEAYKIKFESLRANGHTNQKIWTNISNHLKEEFNIQFNGNQCKSKFAKMKINYQKAKDSRGPKNTGGKIVKFEFFDEFENIFRNSHSHALPGAQSSLSPQDVRPPVKKKSSIEKENNLEIVSDDDDVDISQILKPVPNKEKRKTVTVQLAQSLAQLMEQKEKHHQEKPKKIDEMLAHEGRFNQLFENYLHNINYPSLLSPSTISKQTNANILLLRFSFI